MFTSVVRRAVRFLAEIFRPASGGSEDPHAYVGAARKCGPSRGGAGVALDEPRYHTTKAQGRHVT
jgi:hypothetical protein